MQLKKIKFETIEVTNGVCGPSDYTTIPRMTIAQTQDGVLFSKLLQIRRQKKSQIWQFSDFFLEKKA